FDTGETRWIQWKNRCIPGTDRDGAEVQSVGRDISGLREREVEMIITECGVAASACPFVIYDRMGRITFANRAFLSLFGYSSDNELLGKLIDSCIPRSRVRGRIPPVAEALRINRRWDGEMKGRKKDGTLFDVMFFGNLIDNDPCLPRGGIIGLVREYPGAGHSFFTGAGSNLGTRGMAMDGLRGVSTKTGVRFPEVVQDTIDHLPDAMFVVDRKKKVIAWNRAMEIVTGADRERIIGTTDYPSAFSVFSGNKPILTDLMHVSDSLLAKKYPGVRRVENSLVAESYIPSFKGGQDLYVFGRAGPFIGPDGTRIGTIEGIQDITDWKNARVSLERMKEKIDTSLNRHAGQLEERYRKATGSDD
ncbi:MAG: PAS domain S-box protein, partial [Methanoregulaceae archaeon]|nr:PAS domain S-box protein [Methanoregulaceae archaeon]